MIKQNLIVYANPFLFEVLKELEEELNYKITFVSNKKDLDEKNLSNYLILNCKNNFNLNNVINLNFPFKISKLFEDINIKIMTLRTKEQSSVKIGDYLLNINSRQLEFKLNSVSLTEKEVNLIMFLKKIGKPVNIEKLQQEVWGYKNQLESHTVETHIHRLRKKILSKFNVNNFLLSDKRGYYLKILS